MRIPPLLRAYSTSPSKSVLHELKARGMVAQLTSQHLYNVLDKRKITLYGGVDPSAPSLHVGNLAMLMTLLHFHLHGHHVIPLIGGATGRVGDPGGRTTERDLVAQEQVDHNATSITNQVDRFFQRASLLVKQRRDLSTSDSTILSKDHFGKLNIVNNLSWHSGLSMLSFLRYPGKLMRVNALLTRESIKARLGSSQGISYAEFSYQLLQAYDFYILRRDHNVELQVGGSDQWGNIVSGVELIRKSLSLDEASTDSDSLETTSSETLGDVATEEDTVYGLTIPLLTTSTGEKFGKSAGNAVWLDHKMTSVFDFYQFFMRVPDTEVLLYLRYLTLIPLEEIEIVYADHLKSPERRAAQQRLAAEVTELIHGGEALRGAQLATSILFGSFKSQTEASSLSKSDSTSLLQAIGEHPRLRRVKAEEVDGVPVTRIVADFGLVTSRGKARTLAQAGGLYLNGTRILSLDRKLDREDFREGNVVIVRAGQEQHLILEII